MADEVSSFRRDHKVQKWKNHTGTPAEIPQHLGYYPHYYAIKLATVRLTPKLKLLSFRVSKNYLYLSFARPNTDLIEFVGLVPDDT